jgi:hypothetical protein
MYAQPQVAPSPVEFRAKGRGVLFFRLEENLDDAESSDRLTVRAIVVAS